MGTRLIRLASSAAFLGILGTARGQDAPRSIRGSVSDSLGNRLAYVTVDGGPNLRGLSSALGEFVLSASSRAAVTLELRRIGYLPTRVVVPPGGDTTIAVIMSPLLFRLNAVRIAAERVRSLELHGFYARLAHRETWGSSAQFVTPEEIEFRKPNRVTQLLDDRHGIAVRRVGRCNVIVQCWVPLGPGGCIMTIYVDGQRIMAENASKAMSQATGWMQKVTDETVPFIDALISPTTVSGIEIYQRGPGAPPEYQLLNGSCGVILIWTK
jgi:hypothetical protein